MEIKDLWQIPLLVNPEAELDKMIICDLPDIENELWLSFLIKILVNFRMKWNAVNVVMLYAFINFYILAGFTTRWFFIRRMLILVLLIIMIVVILILALPTIMIVVVMLILILVLLTIVAAVVVHH
jgi:hypothetical protein